jgi:hypothetical protein
MVGGVERLYAAGIKKKLSNSLGIFYYEKTKYKYSRVANPY